jgi:hypothetical protein
MRTQYEGQVPREGRKWKPVHYCCPGHTPPWWLKSGRRRARQREALRRDLAALRNEREEQG